MVSVTVCVEGGETHVNVAYVSIAAALGAGVLWCR